MSQSLHSASPHSQSQSQTLTSRPKPPRLPRSPSDPIHLSQHSHAPTSSRPTSPQQPIYVLTADGSSLFLLDPSKPQGGEEPPPYASFNIRSGNGNGVGDHPIMRVESGGGSSRSSPRGVTFPTLGSQGELLLPLDGSPTLGHGQELGHGHGHEVGGTAAQRHRASTLSALYTHERARPRCTTSNSHPTRRTRSALSTPEVHSTGLVDERTPLLGHGTEAANGEVEGGQLRKRRGTWKSIWCGDLEEGEEVGGWGNGWKRFWRPVGRGEYWRCLLHLVLLNFPFALFVWPPLLVGTLAGTALLITLPIGAAVWWLTLFISRSAARLETIMQMYHHQPLSPTDPLPTYHPIFHRIVPRSSPNTPISTPNSIHFPSSNLESASLSTEFIWEKRFMKCSYAMFLDHYSYSALSYFLLIKPLITLFSTIAVIALLPVGVATVFGFPVYLRAARRWGRWQAEVAMENL
ncbi:hypothetical protein CI109_100005 [Kwoniella shandongensis]|uniref:Uncharacterized protein n=1 Tax=Kwoniella shandongensis TaxID=1734106 RepID=A0A5M6BS72_9TREE|nr:uncharacterized protein CI109_006022 [Kwoniella shandongensis]KAA5525714.1 hypothetical protein CI109_006022 [Kwoniella shandongensis]